MHYRRILQPGETFFFTVVTYQRRKPFTRQENIDLLLKVIDDIQQRYPFTIIAQVVMPDHIHSFWELPPGDQYYPTRWRLIKGTFTKLITKESELDIPPSRRSKDEQAVWQRRYWEHVIWDDLDLERHIDYIHFNPVHHGLVKYPCEW
ncbi:MAG: transposase [Anaerolineaceae bacterium]